MPTDIRYIENGEEVVEQVLNRPVEDVEANLDTLFLEGIPFWSSTVTYDANSLVQENGVVYNGTSQSINALPSASPSFWVRWEGNRQATLNERGTVTISDSRTSTSTITAASSLAAKTLQDEIDDIVQEIASNVPGATPVGGIIMWSGSIASIPATWALCNGTNGTPDLRNRFVVGAGGTYAVGDTGGANSVTLTESQIPSHTHTASSGDAGGHSHTASTGNSGYHSHSGSTNTTGSHSHGSGILATRGGAYQVSYNPGDVWGTGNTSAAGNHSHSLSINGNGSHTHTVSVSAVSDHSHTVTVNSTGGNGSHENRPPYYALAYIMRVS